MLTLSLGLQISFSLQPSPIIMVYVSVTLMAGRTFLWMSLFYSIGKLLEQRKKLYEPLQGTAQFVNYFS